MSLWRTDTGWFDVAVVMSIFAIGSVVFGKFEQHKPRWRRVLKQVLVLAVVLSLVASIGRGWAYGVLALPVIGAAYVHLWWLPKHGINGWTAEPYDRYLALVAKTRASTLDGPLHRPVSEVTRDGPAADYTFTERVRKILVLSREASVRMRHEYVGTEHLLLGLINEGEGVGVTVLKNLHVNLGAVRQTIEDTVKPGKGTSSSGPDLPYTSRAKKVLDLAMLEMGELSHDYVGSEHLLLGLLREEKGIAAQVLHQFGVTLDSARAETVRLHDNGP